MKNAPTLIENPHGRHRPVLIFGRGHSVKRPRGSKLMRHVTRINPAMALRHPGAALKKILSKGNLVTVFGIGGGFAIGTQVSRFLASGSFFTYNMSSMPSFLTSIAPYRKFHGAVSILVGGFMSMSARRPILKDLGIGIAVSGTYDLLAQLLNGATPNKYLPTFAGYNIPRQRVGYSIPKQPTRSLHGRTAVVLGGAGNHMSDYPVDI